MKKEKEKKAIGIYIDGLFVNVAEASLSKNTIIISNLKEFKLEEPLNQNHDLDLNLSNLSSESDSIKFNEPKDSDFVLDDIEDFMGINDDVLFNKPEKKEEDLPEKKEEIITIEPQFDLSSSKFFEASHVFSQLNLKDSFVSFITAEDKLFWNYLPFSSKKINRNKLKSQTLSKDQRKNPNVQFDTIINSDNSGYSLVFEGIHDTFTLLENVQPILNIKNIK